MICLRCNQSFAWSEHPKICVSCEKQQYKAEVKSLKAKVKDLEKIIEEMESTEGQE